MSRVSAAMFIKIERLSFFLCISTMRVRAAICSFHSLFMISDVHISNETRFVTVRFFPRDNIKKLRRTILMPIAAETRDIYRHNRMFDSRILMYTPRYFSVHLSYFPALYGLKATFCFDHLE